MALFYLIFCYSFILVRINVTLKTTIAKPKLAGPLKKSIEACQVKLNEGVVVQKQANEEQSFHIRRIFDPETKLFDVEGMRLNALAGLPNLCFFNDVYAKLTAQQQTTLDEFSRRFDATMAARMHEINPSRFHQLPDLFTKLRFLQADSFQIDAAISRLVKTVIWRQSIGLDDFIGSPDKALMAKYRALRPRRLLGFDQFNRPFLIERLGEFFSTHDRDSLTLEEWVLCYSMDMCEILACIREAVKLFGIEGSQRVAYLGDLNGVHARSFLSFLPMLKALIRQVDTHFPEVAGTIVLVNVPAPAARCWPMVKAFLDPATANKVFVECGMATDKLEMFFGRDVVPVEWGGVNDYVLPHARKSM